MQDQVMIPMSTDKRDIVTTHPDFADADEVSLEDLGSGPYGWWVTEKVGRPSP
jgi:hypothetical protein